MRIRNLSELRGYLVAIEDAANKRFIADAMADGWTRAQAEAAIESNRPAVDEAMEKIEQALNETDTSRSLH